MKKLLLAVIVFASAGLLAGCSLPQSIEEQLATVAFLQKELITPEDTNEVVVTSSSSAEAKSTITINGETETQHELTLSASEDGQTAVELLQANADVQLKEYDFGVFIEGINGTFANNENYWAFYVNDEYAQTGAGETILNAGDIVTFRYEKLNQ